ncbi:hypothetical protein SLA2020_517050, partial [Shorea laevis]
ISNDSALRRKETTGLSPVASPRLKYMGMR